MTLFVVINRYRLIPLFSVVNPSTYKNLHTNVTTHYKHFEVNHKLRGEINTLSSEISFRLGRIERMQIESLLA